MEKNEIHNIDIKSRLGNYALNLLLDNNLMPETDLPLVKMEYGYLFAKDDGVLEALYKIITLNNVFYFALQNLKISLIEITEDEYNQTIDYMFQNHSCLSDNSFEETLIQKNRREKNNQFLVDNNIVISDNLACIFDDSNVKLKNFDDIIRKALGSFFTVQIACDINNGSDYNESKNFFLPLLEKFDCFDLLNSKERRIIDGTFSEQDVIDVGWEYESFWTICWCLGLIDDIKDASNICDCEKAIEIVNESSTYEDFRNKCSLRSLVEILDMQDLYYRYQWAINDSKVNEGVSIGNLDPEVVLERRRALDWIVSDVFDWYDLELNA